MKSKSISTVGAALAVAALAAPASAGAHIETAVSSVKAHTSRADAALGRAVTLFEQARDRSASRSFARSRKQMGKARAEAAKLRRRADSRSERARAARAQRIVARQQDQNVEQLVGVLDEATGRLENKVAKAALSDTRGREKAIAILTKLLERGVSSRSKQGIARAIAALSRDRDDEVEVEVEALISEEVSLRSKRTVAAAVERNVDGQATAAVKLAKLIASARMPAASKQGLRRAYAAVTAEHGSIADILSRFSARMPADVRAFVEQVVRQAREDAEGMRENRPTPPAGGQPERTPGAPAGTPGSAYRP